MNIFKNLLKDTFIYGLAMILPRLMNFALVGLHTATLDTSKYAENTTFYVYAMFANVVLTFGMETAFFRFFTAEKENQKVFTTTLIALVSVAFLFIVSVFVFREQLTVLTKISVVRLQILSSVLFFDTLIVAAFVLYRIQGKALKFAGLKLLSLSIYVIGNFFFLWAVPKYQIELPPWLVFPKVVYIFIANLLASLCVFILVLPTYLKYKWQFDPELFKRMLRYSWPIMVAGLAFAINENLDKLVLRDFMGKEIMGAYSACYKISVFLMLFIQAFRMGVEPFVFNQSQQKNARESYAVVMKFFVVFASLGILFVLSFLDFLKELLIKDPSYWEAIAIVPVLLLANWCLGVYHSLSVWYKLTDRTQFGMYISIVGAVITIAINYIFVPTYGFMAAAYATLAAYACMMLLSYFMGQKYYHVPYPVVRLLGYLGLALAISSVHLFGFVDSFMIKALGILLYLGIIAIFEKNSLERLLK